MYALISKLCFFRSLCYVCGLYSNLREKKMLCQRELPASQVEL